MTSQEAIRKAKRRAEWLADKRCVWCGAIDNLQVDHIDPATKSFKINWGMSWGKLLPELAKCQVLCANCHLEKTIAELEKEIVHGTISAYTNPRFRCRCNLCKQAMRVYGQKVYWKKTRGE